MKIRYNYIIKIGGFYLKMKRSFIVNISEEDSLALERKQYEFNALLSVIGYMAKDSIIDYDMIQNEINELEKRGVALELEKAIIANKYCPEEYDSNEVDWEIDFQEKTINFKLPQNKIYIGKSFREKIEKEDVNKLQLLQYERNISLTLYTYLKEDFDVRKNILDEYLKVVTERTVELEQEKRRVSNKYKPKEVSLFTYDWSIDFINEIIIYQEAKK